MSNFRGSYQIVPLFFITNIKSLIVYKKDGTISLSKKVNSSLRQKDLSNAIDSLGLEHERLRIIRQVWFYIAKSPYTIENVINAIENETLRKNIIADCGIPFTIGKRINQNIYWSLLSEYYWFYNYFLIYNGFV